MNAKFFPNMSEEIDYIKRWKMTGLLDGIHESHWRYVSARLQIAAQNSIAFGDKQAIENEITLLREEGYFTGKKIARSGI